MVLAYHHVLSFDASIELVTYVSISPQLKRGRLSTPSECCFVLIHVTTYIEEGYITTGPKTRRPLTRDCFYLHSQS